MTSSLAAGQNTPPNHRTNGSSIRLRFLDGMRGLAALYVVLFHLRDPQLPAWALKWMGLLQYGHYAVVVFIVLSGYCLMLPVARTESGTLAGGSWEYLKRRAKRILPPYYGALALAILIDWWHERGHGRAIDWGGVVSHFFLVHNFSRVWNSELDIPMWSVATEWQIYFFLPFLLLPIWKRWGIAAALTTAFCIGILPHFALPSYRNLDWACPWFLGLFAIGMAAAVYNWSPGMAGYRTKRVRWTLISLMLVGGLIAVYRVFPHQMAHVAFLSDWILGLAVACLIVDCAGECQGRSGADAAQTPPRWPLRLLESRVAVRLGEFSYSLYLIHSLVFFTVGWFLRKICSNPAQLLVYWWLVLLPCMILFSYLFYLVFERPRGLRSAERRPYLPRAVDSPPQI